MELNIKDKKILAELDLNARATFQELGKNNECLTIEYTIIEGYLYNNQVFIDIY